MEGDEAFVESVNALAEARTDFFQACYGYAQRPVPKRGVEINTAGSTYGTALIQHLELLREHMTAEGLAQSGHDLLCIEDNQRVRFFNVVIGEPRLGLPISRQRALAGELKEQIEDEQEEDGKHFASTVLMHYVGDSIVSDIQSLVEECGSGKKAKVARLREGVGKYALDVSKTAIGTMAGLALMQVLSRRKH